MKKILKICLVVFSLLVLSSCENDFLDVNTNPNASTDVPPGTLMTNAVISLSQVRLTSTGPDGAAYIQHWKPVIVLDNPDTYGFDTNGNNNFYRFTFFGDIIKDLNLAAQGAEERGENNAVAQLRILQAWTWIQGVDRWGEIPFLQANNPEFQFPLFDTGDIIYQGVIDILDNAISLIDIEEQGKPNAITNFDLVYAGDMSSWLKFANSLKLRALMRLSYVEEGDRASEIASLLASADFIDDLNGQEDALFRYVAARNNQNFDYATFDNFTQFGSFALDGETRVHQRWRLASRTMVEYMEETSDPRMFSFFQRDISNADEPITGAINGAGNLPPQGDRGYVSLFYIRQDKSDEWFRASEYHLLAAEAYARNLSPGGIAAAQTALENGLTAAMNIFDGSDFEITTEDKEAFITSIDLASLDDPVSFIQEQQWVALFYNGTEAWANWRRTKRPQLTPVAGADFNQVISRVPLPESAFLNPNAPSPPPIEITPVYYERSN